MPTINGIPFSSIRNINLRGDGSTKAASLRFGRTGDRNPFDSTSNGLYVNASNQLVFSAQGVSTVIGAAGSGGSAPSLDAIFQGDQTLDLANLSTLTIDRSISSSNNILTLTNTGAGSGNLLQITNVGTGKDINGTSGTWSVSKTGAITGLTLALAGTADATSFTLTQGDMLVSDGSLAITDVDNEAVLSVTCNGNTSASMIAFAGSGTFTGSTTTSFMTITPSGLTTGTAVYLPVAGLTTGRALHVVANALTSGIVMNVTSSATAITGAGRLFLSTHSGATGTSATLNEFISAANDETVILQVTASSTLALGVLLAVSASSMTTGKAITANNLDSLTTGMGVHIASAATAITTTGRLLLVDHTGATGTSAILSEFKSAATDETIVVQVTTAAMINGVALSLVGTTGMTTGSVLRATSSTAGAVATNGVFSFTLTGAFTSGASTLGAFHVAGASTVSGTIMSILGGAQTTGIALNITDPSTGMTSGSLLRVITASTGAVATNGIVSFQASGAFTSTTIGFVNVIVSGATAGTGIALQMSATSQTSAIGMRIDQTNTTTGFTGSLFQITASSTTGSGNAINVVAVNTTAGDGMLITNNALTLGAGTLVNLVHGTSVIGAGSSMLRLTSTGVDTGTTTGTMIDIAATAATAARLCQIVSATLTTGFGLHMTLNGLTSGSGLAVISSSADTTARGLIQLTSSSASATGASAIRSAIAKQSTHFSKMWADSVSTCTWWMGDGTTGQGNLSGNAGDVLFNGGSNKPEYCTGTTNWTALV